MKVGESYTKVGTSKSMPWYPELGIRLQGTESPSHVNLSGWGHMWPTAAMEFRTAVTNSTLLKSCLQITFLCQQLHWSAIGATWNVLFGKWVVFRVSSRHLKAHRAVGSISPIQSAKRVKLLGKYSRTSTECWFRSILRKVMDEMSEYWSSAEKSLHPCVVVPMEENSVQISIWVGVLKALICPKTTHESRVKQLVCLDWISPV